MSLISSVCIYVSSRIYSSCASTLLVNLFNVRFLSAVYDEMTAQSYYYLLHIIYFTFLRSLCDVFVEYQRNCRTKQLCCTF